MSEIGISYRAAGGREVHMIGGASDVEAALAEARRGLDIFGAHYAVVFRGRTAEQGEVVATVSRGSNA